MPLHHLARPPRSAPRLLAGLAGAVAAVCWRPPARADAGIAGDHHSPTVVDQRRLGARRPRHVLGRPARRGDFVAYVADRNATADAVAAEMGLDPVAAPRRLGAGRPAAPEGACSPRSPQLGVPYRSHTSEPGVGFDCSGLTAYAWGRAGVDARPPERRRRSAPPRARDQATAVAGDLVQYPGHVMMYLGVGDAIVHAVEPGDRRRARLRHRSVRFGDPTADGDRRSASSVRRPTFRRGSGRRSPSRTGPTCRCGWR